MFSKLFVILIAKKCDLLLYRAIFMKKTAKQPFPARRRRPDLTNSGQAMIEFIIIAAMLIATVAIFSIFLYSIKKDSSRTLELVSYEYP